MKYLWQIGNATVVFVLLLLWCQDQAFCRFRRHRLCSAVHEIGLLDTVLLTHTEIRYPHVASAAMFASNHEMTQCFEERKGVNTRSRNSPSFHVASSTTILSCLLQHRSIYIRHPQRKEHLLSFPSITSPAQFASEQHH